MKSKYKIIFVIIILFKYLHCDVVIASTLSSIVVQNHLNHSTVIICCNIIPVYTIFALHKPERIVIDLDQISKIHKNIFPVEFNSNNLIKQIRTSNPVNCHSIRIVCDLHHEPYIQTITCKKTGKNYCIILTFSKKITSISNVDHQNLYSNIRNKKIGVTFEPRNQYFSKQAVKNQIFVQRNKDNSKTELPIIVAIDAGHGGHDPGAMGCRGIYEKHITFSIARKLKTLLNADPIFQAVMIRDGDYFLSVMDRSDLARKKKANILISIHADSALNPKIRGASVWVLSNRRAKTEMMHWLQRREKHAELLGGLGDILTNYQNDPYFNHLVLDLQFGYSQREGYNIATQMLHQLKNVSFLHKNTPEYSNFGILKSPDIASVLVETGFISNYQEEHLLTTNEYQEKIAQALYKGLRSYFVRYQEKSYKTINQSHRYVSMVN